MTAALSEDPLIRCAWSVWAGGGQADGRAWSVVGSPSSAETGGGRRVGFSVHRTWRSALGGKGVDNEGKVAISTREGAYKTRNLRRDPRVVLCVLSDAFFGRWTQIEGTAQIVSLPEAMEGLVDYYRCISGEHPDWDDYRRAMQHDQRVLVRVSVDAVGPAHAS